MAEYVRTAKAEECIADVREVIKALIEPESVTDIKGFWAQRTEIILSPFTSDQRLINVPAGTPTNGGPTMNFEGSVIAGLVSDIIKPHYDACMGGEPTFVPRKPDTGRSK